MSIISIISCFKDIFIFHPKMGGYYLVLPNPLHYGHWATIILLLFNYSYVGYSMVMQHSWTWNDLPKFFFGKMKSFPICTATKYLVLRKRRKYIMLWTSLLSKLDQSCDYWMCRKHCLCLVHCIHLAKKRNSMLISFIAKCRLLQRN